MESPDPAVYDVYVEYDYWQGRGEKQGANRLSDAQVAQVRTAFEARWEHGEHCGWKGEAGLRVHFFRDDAIDATQAPQMAHIPAISGRYLFFDLFFTPDRKYTNTFHYVVGTPKGAGQSDVSGRAAMVGNVSSSSGVPRLVHEMGHLLSLMHNYDKGSPSNTPFYLSTMNYGYVHTLPPPMDWDGTFARCGKKGACPEMFKCVQVQGMGSVCAPDCGIMDSGRTKGTSYIRFSAGELDLGTRACEDEVIPETGYPKWFLAYYYCFSDSTRGPPVQERVRRFVDPACDGGLCVRCGQDSCSIDWDRDGRVTGAEQLDVDRDGKLEEAGLSDHDDHRRIIELASKGLRPTAKKTLAAFYTDFSDRGGNVLPYPAIVQERHGGYVRDVTNHCDEAARWPHCRDQKRETCVLFRGNASRDRSMEVRFRPESCVLLEQGLSVSLRVKPLALPAAGSPAVLFDSAPLRLELRLDDETPVWTAIIRASDGTESRLELEDSQALGHWTRLTVMVDNAKKSTEFFARRGTTRFQDSASGLTVNGKVCGFDVGAAAGCMSNLFGLIDDPMLLTGPVPEL